jgi:hypothetical protein
MKKVNIKNSKSLLLAKRMSEVFEDGVVINVNGLESFLADILNDNLDLRMHVDNLNAQVEHLLEVNTDMAECLQRGDDINENILDHFDDTSEIENLTIKKVTDENQNEFININIYISMYTYINYIYPR